MSSIQQMLLGVTPAAGGGGAALVQRSTVERGDYSSPVCTFSTDVTAGNTLVIFAGLNNDVGAPSPTVVTSQTDTVVLNTAQIGTGPYGTTIGYVASAVGGSTTVTLSGVDRSSIYVEEWENIAFDSGAGFGSIFGTTPQTASTPNSSTVADGVSFTVLSVWGTVSMAAQTVPSGWTEGGRYNDGPGFAGQGQVIGAYRAESTTGVKSAAWTDDVPGEYLGVQVATFSQT
jgi:hypothetical protein